MTFDLHFSTCITHYHSSQETDDQDQGLRLRSKVTVTRSVWPISND